MQCSTGITCRKFYNRLRYCYYFKERETYVKSVRLLFNKILTKYNKDSSLVKIFSDEFSGRTYVGSNSVLSINREQFKVFCLKCIENLDRFMSKYNVEHIMNHYCYKWKIKGTIHGTIDKGQKTYNVSMSFENRQFTEKSIDFYALNNYLYNECNRTKNDLIVMCVPEDSFYIIPYEDKDYTIQRGFLTYSRGNKLRFRGEHCNRCANSCKPKYYNGLDRLDLAI